MSLQNLKSELVRNGVKQYEVAEFLGMTNSNFAKKLSESVPITREEMYAIRDEYFPGTSIDYLFQSDGDKPTKSESLHAQAEAIGDILRQAEPDDEEGIAEVEGAFHDLADEYARRYPEEPAEEVS